LSFIELFILAVGLSMDAFAVAICKGLSAGEPKTKHYICVGLYFGGFQALMPLIGYLLGSRFQKLIENVDHWIAFILLVLIGANMIHEAFGDAEGLNADFSVRAMLPLALATSIDALAVGVTFAFLEVHIAPAVTLIGVTTCLLSAFGLWLGKRFGAKYRSRAVLAGGIVLILIGIKILLEHLGVFAAIGAALGIS